MPALWRCFGVEKEIEKILKKVVDKTASVMYTNEAEFSTAEFQLDQYGGVTQLVEYPVHTRPVTCSSQVAATRPVGQAVKTPPFHGGNMGSIPVRVTKKRDWLLPASFFASHTGIERPTDATHR